MTSTLRDVTAGNRHFLGLVLHGFRYAVGISRYGAFSFGTALSLVVDVVAIGRIGSARYDRA